MVLLQVLEHWGYEGFDSHVQQVADFYRKRKDQCIKAAEKHLTGETLLEVFHDISVCSL